ncbi:MAG: hypothetical protein IH609_16565 [Dehalococcoidia bacterium]|nr:hypothetical protein [Dehalococcoidia bacterium]
MADALEDAYAKLAWAAQRIVELRPVVEGYIATEESRASVGPGAEPGVVFQFGRDDSPIPTDISNRVGEIANHLRSALDYLVGQLALLQGEAAGSRNQFPIEESATSFVARTGTFLKGVSPEHIETIRKQQPFEGGTWLSVLRDASNQDKHNELIRPSHQSDIEVEIDQHADGSVRLRYQAGIQLVFADEMPIVDSLEFLHAQVTAVLDLFHPECQR